MMSLDTNRINSRGKLPNVTQLEKWAKDGVIILGLSETAMKECHAGSDAIRSEKASGYIYAIASIDSPRELEILRDIERIVFPLGPKDANERNDVAIAFTASKYNEILVTADGDSRKQPGGLLGHRKELSDLGVRIMSDEEAVQHVRIRIKDRDILAARAAKIACRPEPDWLGKD
jgi:hypothetical protein